jgi:hypothetical protein
MPHVFLDPDGTSPRGLLLLVEAPTGVIYEQQCGGHANELMSLEGFLIPLGAQAGADTMYEWFQKTFRGQCHKGGNHWNAEHTQQLQALIGRIPCWYHNKQRKDERHFLQLDMARLGDCLEAWIPVISPYGHGILTLKNSD